MHLYAIVRGNKPKVDRWVEYLLSQFFPYKYRYPLKDYSQPIQDGMLQLSVRPVQMYEFVFPQTSYKDVLSLIHPYGNRSPKMAFVLRKMLGASPIKEKVAPHWSTFMKESVDVTSIGIKKDLFKKGVEFI